MAKLPTSCLDQAKALAAGKGLSEEEVENVFERYKSIHERFTAQDTHNVDARVARYIVEDITSRKIKAAQQRKHAALNVIVRERVNDQIRQLRAQGMTSPQAIRTLMEGSQVGIKLARKSVYNQSLAYEARYVGGIFAAIEKEHPHVMALLKDKHFNDDLMREMYELRMGGKPGKTKNLDAQNVAKIMAAHLELSRKEMNGFGATIGKLDGYMGIQTHDDFEMRKVGEAAWVSKIKPLLDVERTFPELKPEKLDEVLGDVYRTIVNDVQKSNAVLTGNTARAANLANKLSMSRKLHFKDAEAAIKYNDTFGRGEAVNIIISQQRYAAKLAAAMEAFGPNPEVMLHSIIAREKLNLVEMQKGKSPEQAAKLVKEAEQTSIPALQPVIDAMTGVSSSPVNATLSKINNNVRGLLSIAKLGGALLTAMPTDTFTAALDAFNRGEGFFKGLFNHLGRVHEGFKSTEARHVAYLLGEAFDGLSGHISSAALAHDGAPGVVSSWAHTFFKYSGLQPWTDAARGAAARAISAHLGSEVSKGFDNIHAKLRHVLELNGIDAGKWEVIRQGGLTEANGSHYVIPSQMQALSDAQVKPLLSAQIKAATEAAGIPEIKGEAERARAQARLDNKISNMARDMRNELELDVQRFISDEVNYSVIETDAKSRRFANWGGNSRPGTLAGEAIRYMMQFKGFPIAFSERVLGRGMLGGDMGYAPVSKAQRILNSKAAMAQIIVGMTIAGYMSMTMKDAAKGYWPPRKINAKSLQAAMLQGGGLGIYGDFLFGQTTRFGNSLYSTVLGPGATSAADILNLGKQTVGDLIDPEKSQGGKASKALDLALSNTPFVNLFYLRPALDYLIINQLHEALSKGYNARKASTRMGDYGQDSLWANKMAGK